MVSLTINGKTFQIPEDSTILEGAEMHGINIPTLCHDRRLVAHGACRMCVVEVEGAKSLMAACTTPVSDGMIIRTHSQRVVNARKDILELIWSNHPNDCLTCEKSGECKLQEYCYEYDIKGEDGYEGEIRDIPLDDSNEFYYNDQRKCILCGKCVRICGELQCTGAIGFSARGFKTHVTHPFEEGMNHSTCVSCGNCVSACPVGALMPKGKEKFRNWETKKVRTTCSYCGVGCQIDLVVKDNKVVRVDPAHGPSNGGLLCVKGKFGFGFIGHPDRLKTPLIKKDGIFIEATWDEAYKLIRSKVGEIKGSYGPNAFAALSSARCTSEENYLMQKLFRAVIGTNNVDHCARL